MSDDGSDYRINFLERGGHLIAVKVVKAKSATAAVLLAAEIAADLEATDLSIMLVPSKASHNSDSGRADV